MSERGVRVRMDRSDLRFIALCLGVIAIGALIVRWGFTRAFPEAAIDFKVTRDQAREIASRALTEQGFDLTGTRGLVVFDYDDEAKVFLERTLGLQAAMGVFERKVPVWHWSVRFVRPLQKLEYRAWVSPAGELRAYRRLLPEDAPAADPGDDGARRLAESVIRTMRGLEPGSLRFIEASKEKRPARVDRSFVWESSTVRFGDAALRYLVEVQGDRVGRSSITFEIPEKWKREYKTLRSKNDAASSVATLGLFLTALAALGVLIERIRRKDVKWRWAISFGVTAAVLWLASQLNELPIALFDYETTDGWGGFVTRAVLGAFGGAVLAGLGIAFLVAAGEPLYRETYPGKAALGRIFSRGGMRSKRFLRGVVLGYALAAFFFAYQVVFYIVAERFGAWAPADIPYSNLLGTSFPWLAVLVMGFIPATSEEFWSRMFSIPFAQRFLPTWVAVLIPALIWSFAHSGYPNQPFYIRGVEVGIVGVIIGAVMLRAGIFPLLVWHFTVDAVYTALLLLRSSSTYFVVSGALAASVLLVPAVVSLVLYMRDGGFLPDEAFTNASVGTEPAPPRREERPPEAYAAPRPLPARLAWSAVALAAAVLVLSRTALPRLDWGKDAEPRIDRSAARAVADAFLRSLGDDPKAYLAAPLSGSALPSMEASDSGADLVPYQWSGDAERWLVEKGGVAALKRWATRVLPGPVWQVRYVRPLDEHGAWIVVDARSGAVVGMKRTFPEDERGASLTEGAARVRAAEVLGSFRLDPADLAEVSLKAEKRKARTDYRLVYESRSEGVGAGRRRAVVELVGNQPALLATALKLPEEWVRARGKWTPSTWAALVWKIAGLGTFLGIVLVELFRAIRAGTIPWRRLVRLSALLVLPVALRLAVSFPKFLQGYRSDIPLGFFTVVLSVGLVVAILLYFAAILMALALVSVVRPDAEAVFRSPGPARRAFAAAAVAVLLVVAGRALGQGIAAAWPIAAGTGDLPWPAGVDTLFPAMELLEAIVLRTLLLASVAALAFLVIRDHARTAASRAVLLLALAGASVPFDARTPAEVLVPVLVSAVGAAALLAALAVALRNDVAAYVITAAALVALRGGANLLTADPVAWKASGAVVIVTAAAIAALFAIRRGAVKPVP